MIAMCSAIRTASVAMGVTVFSNHQALERPPPHGPFLLDQAGAFTENAGECQQVCLRLEAPVVRSAKVNRSGPVPRVSGRAG